MNFMMFSIMFWTKGSIRLSYFDLLFSLAYQPSQELPSTFGDGGSISL